MTTAVERTQRFDRVTDAARQVHFGRTMALWLAATLYTLGFVAAKVLRVVWFALAWAATAVRLGWSEARAKPDTDAV